MYIMVWVLFFALMFLFFYFYTRDKSVEQIQNGSLAIKADKQGHFKLKGKINEETVTFLVDTGATLVAIPQKLANRLQLEALYPIEAETANGIIKGYLTRLPNLNLGNFQLKNVKAVIMPDSAGGTALLGMNVLSKFELIQKEGNLIISKRQ